MHKSVGNLIFIAVTHPITHALLKLVLGREIYGSLGYIAHNIIYIIDTLVHLHNREHGVDPRSDAMKRNIGIYTSTEGR
jgi:hypothetical protein